MPRLSLATLLLIAAIAPAASAQTPVAEPATPLAIGETFTFVSRSLGDVRRINVYTPAPYASSPAQGLTWHYEHFANDTHATIYHPAALRALRLLFKPPAGK